MRTVQNGSGLCIFQSSLSSDVGALDLDNILSQEEIDALLSAFPRKKRMNQLRLKACRRRGRLGLMISDVLTSFQKTSFACLR